MVRFLRIGFGHVSSCGKDNSREIVMSGKPNDLFAEEYALEYHTAPSAIKAVQYIVG